VPPAYFCCKICVTLYDVKQLRDAMKRVLLMSPVSGSTFRCEQLSFVKNVILGCVLLWNASRDASELQPTEIKPDTERLLKQKAVKNISIVTNFVQ
jgi:hypothetical protein